MLVGFFRKLITAIVWPKYIGTISQVITEAVVSCLSLHILITYLESLISHCTWKAASTFSAQSTARLWRYVGITAQSTSANATFSALG